MTRKILRSFIFIFIFIIISSSHSYANTYTVSNSNSDGSGSLSWAVQSVNYIGGGNHIIEFDSRIKNVSVTSELTLRASVTIRGHGAALTGNAQNRIFSVTSGHVIFDSLTFTNGHAVSSNGGAVNIEGAGASCEFRNCTFFGNMADNYGGAICITNGSANPRTTLIHCTISGNLARTGGGIAALNGDAALFSSVITGNSVSYDIFSETTAAISGRYNVTGSSNHDLGYMNMNDIAVHDVLSVNENGNVNLESVNSVYVLKLSGSSLARDYVPVSEVSYVLSVDETGTKRPQLSAYDAGAYEAAPVPVSSVDVYGMPYMQVNSSERYSLDVYPHDASVAGIRWSASPQSVLTVDASGYVHAIGVGVGYITAEVQGWNSTGEAITTRSNAQTVYVGTEARSDFEASITELPNMAMNKDEYRIITPEVYITVNEVSIGRLKGWIKYELNAYSSRPDIADAEIVSGDSVRIITGNVTGSCDITITAEPLPSGIPGSETFTVSVSDKGTGHSKGGGGCNSAGYGIVSALIIFALSALRKETKD